MRKTLLLSALTLSIASAALGTPRTTTMLPTHAIKTTPLEGLTKKQGVPLYAKATRESKQLATLNANQMDLAVIQQKGVWLKVGNRANGTVGWVNKQDLRFPIQGATPTYIHYQHHTDPRHHESETVYRYSTQDTQPDQYMQHAMLQEQRALNHAMRAMHPLAMQDPFFQPAFMQPFMMQPIIIVEKRDRPAKAKATAKAPITQ